MFQDYPLFFSSQFASTTTIFDFLIMDFPMVSIIIPTYNYANYIAEAIHSILQQDYPKDKIEIIVVDDGSTDNTKGILQTFIDNNIIRYFYQENAGKASATIKAVREANGKYIFNLDADDYFLPNKVATSVKVFEDDESIVHVASPAKIFCEVKNVEQGAEQIPLEILGTKISGHEILRYFYENNIFYGSGSTFSSRASVLKKICIPAEVDMYIDEFLVLAVLPFGNSFFIESPLSVWRAHSANYSGKTTDPVQQGVKGLRLNKSSTAVLNYLEKNNYEKRIIKIYRLKNINRLIAYKETLKTKTLGDIAQYAKEVFFNIKPGLSLVKKYQVFNRLMPLPLYSFLKKMAKTFSAGGV